MLGDRHRDAADVGLLKGVRPDGGAGHLTRDRDDRHGVHVGVRDRCHEVGGSRPGGCHADPDATSGLRVALSCVAGTLLVTHEDVAHLLGVHQRVVRRQDRATGDPEYDVDPGVLQ